MQQQSYTVCKYCKKPLEKCICVCAFCGELDTCTCALGDAATGGDWITLMNLKTLIDRIRSLIVSISAIFSLSSHHEEKFHIADQPKCINCGDKITGGILCIDCYLEVQRKCDYQIYIWTKKL